MALLASMMPKDTDHSVVHSFHAFDSIKRTVGLQSLVATACDKPTSIDF